jgi:5'-nucleotidase
MASDLEDLDIIIGSYSGSSFGDGQPGSGGAYPTVVKTSSGKQVIIATTGSRCRYLGFLTVAFDKFGEPVKWSGRPIILDESSLAQLNAPDADPKLEEYLEGLSLSVKELLKNNIGEIKVQGEETQLDQDTESCRYQECRSGDVLADAIRAGSSDGQISLINGGSIRASLPVGVVSEVDISDMLPFNSFVWHTEISGQTLKEVLEHSISTVTTRSTGRFLQVSGIRFTYNITDNIPNILKIFVLEDNDWKALDPNGKYNLVTTDYLGKGGGGYEMLKGLKWIRTDELVETSLVNYLKKVAIDADFEWRIKAES